MEVVLLLQERNRQAPELVAKAAALPTHRLSDLDSQCSRECPSLDNNFKFLDLIKKHLATSDSLDSSHSLANSHNLVQAQENQNLKLDLNRFRPVSDKVDTVDLHQDHQLDLNLSLREDRTELILLPGQALDPNHSLAVRGMEDRSLVQPLKREHSLVRALDHTVAIAG